MYGSGAIAAALIIVNFVKIAAKFLILCIEDHNSGVSDEIELGKGFLESSRSCGVGCEERSPKRSTVEFLFKFQISVDSSKTVENGFL